MSNTLVPVIMKATHNSPCEAAKIQSLNFSFFKQTNDKIFKCLATRTFGLMKQTPQPSVVSDHHGSWMPFRGMVRCERGMLWYAKAQWGHLTKLTMINPALALTVTRHTAFALFFLFRHCCQRHPDVIATGPITNNWTKQSAVAIQSL